jgi:phosphate/sulfate permease
VVPDRAEWSSPFSTISAEYKRWWSGDDAQDMVLAWIVIVPAAGLLTYFLFAKLC